MNFETILWISKNAENELIIAIGGVDTAKKCTIENLLNRPKLVKDVNLQTVTTVKGPKVKFKE